MAAPASPGPPSPAEPTSGASPAKEIARVALVVATTAGGTGAHVRMLAAGFAARGIEVTVLGPASAGTAFGFGAPVGVTFLPVEVGDRPRLGDVVAALRLRRLLRAGPGRTRRRQPAGSVVPGRTEPVGSGLAGDAKRPDVVHAHGLRAGALTVLALAGPRGWGRRGRRPGLVVTVHNARPVDGLARSAVYRLLEHVVARGADLVLCVSSDLEARMRLVGARQVGRAIVSAADLGSIPAYGPEPSQDGGAAPVSATVAIPATAAIPTTAPGGAPPFGRIDASMAGRPVVLAVGRLAAQKDFGTLLEAAAHWRDLAPVPLLVIAGDGPLAADLRARAASLGIDATFLGHRDDVADLLAAATVFVLPSRWEGQPLVLQEALRAGAAIVASRVGGIPDVVGSDAAVLVAPGDAQALAAAVRRVLADVSLAGRLRAAAARRGAALPGEGDAVAAALAAYAQLGDVA